MKLAFITPRYGGEIAAGAEHACRLLAEQLSLRHDVEVLTTSARDRQTWKNEYGEGADRVRGVLVRRFAVNQPHDADCVAGVLRSHSCGAALPRRRNGLGPPARAFGARAGRASQAATSVLRRARVLLVDSLDDRPRNGRRARA